jgi:Asp-tRNA(Asn)/Glu-tRNA(Gln) amidotransferase A subunit family amidase
LTAKAPKRIGIVKQFSPSLAAPEQKEAFRLTLKRLGAELVELDIPGAGAASPLAFAFGALECSQAEYASLANAPMTKLVVAIGKSFKSELEWLEARRAELRSGLEKAFKSCEMIAAPTTAIAAPAMSRSLRIDLLSALAYATPIANLTGTPGIAIPCGKDSNGRPLSTMLMGPAKSETELLQAALTLHE